MFKGGDIMRKKGNTDENEKATGKKSVLLILEIAALVTITVGIIIVFRNNAGNKIVYESQPYIYHSVIAEETTRKRSDLTSADPSNKSTTGSGLDLHLDYNAGQSVNALPDPSGWSRAQILQTASDAIRKTKAYMNPVTVEHSEAFVANITECTGGAIVKTVANLMMGWIVKPVNETLQFNNGMAMNSEGENFQLLLPKHGGFTLTESGISDAAVFISNNEYVIRLNIVPESVGMYDIPVHNAASIGYLDVANYDISFLTVDSADIVYKGSSIELRINSDGYVTAATYKIPLNVKGTGHRGEISGALTFDGEQSEIWKFNW